MHKRVMDPGSPDVSTERLMLAIEQMVRHVRRSATAGGLSTAASSALSRLGREGPQRLTELARAENASQPNMTQLVTRLERAGLVRRTADHSDGRGVLVAATEAGAGVFHERRAERVRALEQLMDELTGPEREAVRVALPALARVIADRPARP
ncbi:MarR family winged helix-turn-helix transcriptional regulator [Streptomyces sp. NPDC058045]|uniref:MarR family winged helix-turn-helix transcriptional regulator n=1 Tax=Streptomyces sp. NPDC058045 TaxID=3346311 RepID=UPI0036EADFCD